jgi:hypothetical protein
MTGYVVSKGGTFGVVQRSYLTEDRVPCIVVSWGPLGWVTPLREEDCKQLRSSYESEARAEAMAWLALHGDVSSCVRCVVGAKCP